jgi:hypothetical protein
MRAIICERPAIPKGLRLKAQGCEERATLGHRRQRDLNPDGVAESAIGLITILPFIRSFVNDKLPIANYQLQISN